MEHLNLIYKGAHSNTLYSCYYDGTNWHGNTTISSQGGNIDPESNYNPAVVVLNNWLYMIYKSATTSELCCAWHDGTKWNGGIEINKMNGSINPLSNANPNAAVYKGMLYITYLDPSSPEIYTASFDGTTWFGNEKIGDQSGGIDPESRYTPAICAYQGNLHIIYTGSWFNNLYSAHFDGINWYGNTEIANQPGGISPKSSYSPGVGVFNNRLYMVYLGSYSRSFYSAYLDGTTWYGNTTIESQPGNLSPKSNYNPSLDVYRGKLYLAYKGSHLSTLYTATFDGTTWVGNTEISSQPGGISPGSNYNPGIAVSAAVPGAQPGWLKTIPDTTPIGDINLPGTHDSAAINGSISTPYACHNNSITQQLEYGIRLLDVRLQISLDKGKYVFYTCHGDIGSPYLNVYQSFPSLMDECKTFLTANTSETILMSLKVDDWSNAGGNEAAAYAALQTLLLKYQVASQAAMPTLGAVRGKIFLYNRMNQDLNLGVPIGWKDNTQGSNANPSAYRSYNIFVQDQYEGLPLIGHNEEKLKPVTDAFGHKQAGNTVFNFASATWYKLRGVYIMDLLLNYIGEKTVAKRPGKFGWLLLDYAFNKYNTGTYGALDIVSIIIASNFSYKRVHENL